MYKCAQLISLNKRDPGKQKKTSPQIEAIKKEAKKGNKRLSESTQNFFQEVSSLSLSLSLGAFVFYGGHEWMTMFFFYFFLPHSQEYRILFCAPDSIRAAALYRFFFATTTRGAKEGMKNETSLPRGRTLLFLSLSLLFVLKPASGLRGLILMSIQRELLVLRLSFPLHHLANAYTHSGRQLIIILLLLFFCVL